MRTIKFRARRKNGKWVVGNFINHFSTYFKTEERHSIFLPKPENDNGGYWVEDIDPETVGQFTGLYDCDGKEIFEGDILDFNGLTVEVRFVRGVFAFLANGDLDEELCGDCRTDLFAKVIGNVHDNPELLKGGKKYKD